MIPEATNNAEGYSQGSEDAGGPAKAGAPAPAPVAVASRAQSETQEKNSRTPYSQAPKTDPDDMVSVSELNEKRVTRDRDTVDVIVGALLRVNNGAGPGWIFPKTNRTFVVTRWYPHQKVAIDFPRNAYEETVCPKKADVLRKLGIAYVVVPRLHGTTDEELLAMITKAREGLPKRKSAAAGRANA
jgi:hypothetical protein